jgi:glycosyltransferase involved in cell wall biosynthesis
MFSATQTKLRRSPIERRFSEMPAPKRLCLNMIVKNEMANLERCLSSVAPYISCWVIGDTGSTDGTQDYIRSFFAERGIPGELHEFPFVDFAQARNEALHRARGSCLNYDYLLLTDADMELTVQDQNFAADLKAAVYQVLQKSGVSYWNTRLIHRGAVASYKGVTHEFVHLVKGEARRLDGISYIDHATGSNRVEKYERDVRLLTNAIASERDGGMVARYTFYLANTIRDAGQNEAALAEYSKRAKMGHWQEEVYVSLYNVAKIREELDHPVEQVIGAYEEATRALGSRAEALHDAARFCRKGDLFERGYEFARRGLAITYPKDSLFVVDWIYDYGLLDELAINAYWCGKYAQCIEACHRLLTEGKLPSPQHERVEMNRRFAQDKLSEDSDAGLNEYGQALRVARAKEETAQIIEDVLEAYARTQTIDPGRAEGLHGAARYCRNKGLYERGYLLAMQGRCVPFPTRAPERERWIYDYGLLDELAVNAFWSEHYADCVAVCNRLLSEGKLPESERPRILKNKQFAEDKLKEINAAGWSEPDTFVRLLRAARERERIQAATEEIIQAYRGAAGADPNRAEAWHGLARYFRNQGMYEEGYEAAKQGLTIAKPMQAPFLESWIYDYGLLDELAINAYWAEKYDESAVASQRILEDRKIPSEQIGRINENLDHAFRKVTQGSAHLNPSLSAKIRCRRRRNGSGRTP